MQIRRERSTCLLAVAALVFASTAAQAAPMTMNGTLRVTVGPLGGPELTGSGIGSSAGGVGSDFTAPEGLFDVTEPISVELPDAPLGLGLLTVPASPGAPLRNEAGSFGAGPTEFPLGGNLGGAMGNNGVARLFFDEGTPAGTVPLGYIGGGGTGTAFVAEFPVTMIGAIWSNLGVNEATPTVTTVIEETAAGLPVTITASAFDRRTAGGRGSVQLVAPASARLAAGILGTLPVVGILTLEFVPEPGMLLVGGTALVTMLAIARKRADR